MFKQLLMSFYCTSKWLVNNNSPERIIPSTVLFFSFPFTFISSGIYLVLFLSFVINTTKNLTILVIGGFLFISPSYYLASKLAKNGLIRWKIEKEYKTLSKNKRINKIVLAFIIFWGTFIIQFWLANIALSFKN